MQIANTENTDTKGIDMLPNVSIKSPVVVNIEVKSLKRPDVDWLLQNKWVNRLLTIKQPKKKK